MTAVNSQLNPLANAFIPTYELSANKDAKYSIENEAKTAWERRGKRNSNDSKSEYKIWPDVTIKLDYQRIFWKNTICDTVTSMINVVCEKSTSIQTDIKLGGSKLPMLPEYVMDDDQKLAEKSKADSPVKTFVEKDKCNCPPMFGWVIPPDFIGNPFNFKYECGKRYPHSPNCTAKRESEDTLDKKISEWTLEQCSSAVKDIIEDVCETISEDSDPITKWDDKYKIQDYLEVSDSDSSDEEGNELDGFGTEIVSRTATEPELVDDGIHPLLQLKPTAYEDEKDGVENVEEILSSLSSPLPEYLDGATSEVGVACNPPCSQWCEFLPAAAKSAFRKYVQKSGNANDHKECHQRSATWYRPVFKRSLSADDAPMFGKVNKGLNRTSEIEAREMILLRRKDPLNYFKVQSGNTLMEGMKHGSCDFTDQQLLASSVKSSMWGKFDGADSLWRPLPECNPVNTHNQKMKKGRETRRQRTMS